MWTLPYDPHPEYATLKGLVYGKVDPRMQAFFPLGVKSTIRLDEIDWGGVTVNGIPPLRLPKMLPAATARYLGDSNIVFGIVVNGEARAYPKRILAWHEMAIDRIGLRDRTGRQWHVTETALVEGGAAAEPAPRVSAQRAFWFGWYAQFPHTLLIK